MSEPVDRRTAWRDLVRRALPASSRRAAPPAPPPAPPPARPRIVRPPGAGREAAFLARCAPGCRSCVDACPVHVIIPSLDPHQPGGGDGRPFLLPEQAACVLCGLCMWACPTDALVPTPPEEVRLGEVRIDAALCVRAQGEECARCISACPWPGVAISEYRGFPFAQAAKCTGCGACAQACPSHAILVMPRG